MSATVKHTPGEWFATTRQGSWDWVVASVDDPNIEICQMFHDGTDLNETGEANACLVAAAPEMLGELKAEQKWLENTADYLAKIPGLYASVNAHRDRLKAVRAAIAKATGERP